MKTAREELINRFQQWLATNPDLSIRAVECANIAEEYAATQAKGRSGEILNLFHHRYGNGENIGFSKADMIDFALAYATQAKGGSGEESLFLVTYRYTNRTDASIHEDTVSAIDCEEAVTKVCANHNFEVEWHTVKELDSTPPVTPQDEHQCQCGEESTGNTTICCCNVCGLPLPTEPWHFNLPTPSTHSEVGEIKEVFNNHYGHEPTKANKYRWQGVQWYYSLINKLT